MRTGLLLFLLGPVMSVHADTFVYVSMAPEETIRVYQLDTKRGTLTEVQSLKVKGAPGCLMPDHEKKHLFASLRTTNQLASYRIDATTGKLTPLSSIELPKGENAAFVAPDPKGEFLISASYAAGKVVVHPLKRGEIQPSTHTLPTAKTAHCVTFGPKLVYVPHVATNSIYELELDRVKGKVLKQGDAPGGAPKAGPRHLAMHPTRPLAFSSDETGSSITMYRVTPGGLKPVQTMPTLPETFKASNTTAEVKVHPSGKYVWVSNRGHESLAGFKLDEHDQLVSLGQTPTEKTPRSFDITADGSWLLGAGEGSGKLAVFRINSETGALKREHTLDVGKSLTWVKAITWDGHAKDPTPKD